MLATYEEILENAIRNAAYLNSIDKQDFRQSIKIEVSKNGLYLVVTFPDGEKRVCGTAGCVAVLCVELERAGRKFYRKAHG